MTTMWWSGARSDEGRVALVIGPWIAYAILFVSLYGVVGPRVSLLVLFPVAFVAGLTGMRTGLLAGLISAPMNLILARFIGDVGSVASIGGTLGITGPVLVGVAVGWLHDLVEMPLLELQERERIDAEVNQQLAERTHNRLAPHMGERGLPEPWAQYVAVLVDQCIRMAGAVDSVVKLSTLDGESTTQKRRRLDLNSLVDDVVIRNQPRAQAEGLLLVFEPGPGRPEIRAVAEQLEQVIESLVVNAIRFTSEGFIRVRTDRDDRHAYVRVEDTGVGIAPAELERLRARLTSSDVTDADAPTAGVGLRIAKAIVDRHEGQIEVSSTSDVGSEFTVTLPLVDIEASRSTSNT